MDAVMEKWRWVLVVVVVFCFGSVWGQFGKERVIIECEVCGLKGVRAVDFDNDQDIDIIAASGKLIAFYGNDGKGGFSKQKILFETAENKYIVDIQVADLDLDGHQDIVFSEIEFKKDTFSTRIGKARWLKNTRSSQPLSIFDIGDIGSLYLPGLFVADFDYDGDMDVIPSCSGFILKNDGQQNFTKWGRDLGEFRVLEDIDKDGFIDLIASDFFLTWYKNDGKGNLSKIAIDSFYPRVAIAIDIADIDGDGNKDIITGSFDLRGLGINELFLYKYDGHGKISLSKKIADLEEAIVDLKIADIDKDGDQDIVASLGNYGDLTYKLVWFTNDGKGNFQPSITIVESGYDGFAALDMMDIDGDSHIDIVSAFLSNELRWHKNDGKGNFSHFVVTQPQVQGVHSVKTGDLDGDGDFDIVSASLDDDKIALFKNVQKGVFANQIVITDKALGVGEIDLFDVDGDRDLDIIAPLSLEDKIVWYKNEGNSIFSGPFDFSKSLKKPKIVRHADLDNDGLEDIIASNRDNKGVIQWYKNNGNGVYQGAIDIRSNRKDILDFFVHDMDLDGTKDIILYQYYDSYIYIFNNNGDGTFSGQTLPVNGYPGYPGELHVVDFDGDGDPDLFFGNEAKGVNFYENNGKGGFQRYAIDLGSIGRSVFASLDMDGDGNLEIIYGFNEDKIFCFAYTKEKKFKSFTFNKTATHDIDKIVAADLDSDQDADFIYLYSLMDKIAWYENQSNHPSISGFTFWDENNNHKYDSSEQKIFNLPVNLEPTALASYTDAQGQYRFYAPEGKYRISVAPDSCWELSTDSLSYQVLLEKGKSQVRHFGFKPTSSAPKLKVRLNSAPTRCGFEVSFWLSLHNEACLFTQGRYGLVMSKLANFVQAEPAPSQIQGDTLFWDVDQLYGSQSKSVKLLFRIAGTDFLGDTILMRGLAYVKNNTGQLLLANTYDYRSEIRCAYDPNDKLVQPTRIPNYNQNLTLFKERMEYTVRFQNTGTDTAFTVIIRDTLDGNLDLKTFKPIMASHPVETHLGKDGAIEFLFRNILLPPTKTNEPFSHGFVRYQVSAKAGLAEQTEIANTAHIYFDYNPPITTNTTGNIMVSAFPNKGGQGQTGIEAKVYPNPFFDYLQVEIVKNNTNATTYTFYLQNSQAQVLLSQQLNGTIEGIDTGQLPSGLYFYLIKNAQGQVVASGKVVCR